MKKYPKKLNKFTQRETKKISKEIKILPKEMKNNYPKKLNKFTQRNEKIPRQRN